jgi:tight adherence protein B
MSGWAAMAVLADAAAGLVLPGRATPVLARLGPRTGGTVPGALVAGVLAACVLVVAIGVLPVLAGGVVAVAGWRLARRRSDRVGAERRRNLLGELLAGLVAELRSGADPRPAMAAAAGGLPALGPLVMAAGRPAGDVRRELDRLAGLPGGRVAGDLAAAWHLAEVTGCGLAAPADRVLSAHRAEDRLRRELAAQLAGTVATARLLAGLPVAGVAMGEALGADPLGFLLGTGPGRLCLGAGLALVAVGTRWTTAITRAASASWTDSPGGGP